MTRNLSFLFSAFLLCAFVGGCDGGGGTSTTTTGTGGTGNTGGEGGTGGSGGVGGATGGGGQGGTGGMSAICGDGALGGAEACDDGNTAPGDGCDDACGVETGYSCIGEPSDCVTICGDGLIVGAEQCDDGNLDADDGCDGACGVEAGYSCDGEPSACATICGDGFVIGAEQCDDGNLDAGDGCDGACAIETGYLCDGEPTICDPICGDGLMVGAEQCDDGNPDAGDGCDDVCGVETGYSCAGEPSVCGTVCGDGLIVGLEQCDDQNTAAGDGCSDVCDVEVGYNCVAEPSVCGPVCGDGILAGNEGCDDAGTAAGDGCDANCAIETGYACMGEPSACATVCGDGIIVAAEQCDDGNPNANDGCSDLCVIETGYACMGAPSACATVCGDGIIAGAETCDDSGTAVGDGCSDVCMTESGYVCSGQPSMCATVCGDGIVAGTEQCDDGNQVDGDGCSALCTPNTGESCADPLVMSQATQVGGTYTWSVAGGSVTATDGEFACDPNTKGPDIVVEYVKTTDTLANGGQLLHVAADTPATTTTSYYLNVEVKGGACEAGSGTSHKCVWYKDNWDAYLDVPPGTYYIWVQKNSPATATVLFPEVTIVAEEVDAADAEGEGCFAPYTSMSSIYTPPGGAGQPHTWTIPASINSFDMGATWGEPGSISCDNHATYGDIHGVDAVVEYDKQSATSVLKIDVQNLDPTQTQSDLNIEVLNVCDPASMSKISRNCRANRDSFSITAPSPAGPVYLWVSTEATNEEMNGASLQVTEIFPGIGESWPTAEPLTGSGPIVATSTQQLDTPSCFPAAGNIHWFSYTITNDALNLVPNAAGILAVYDQLGQELGCGTNFSSSGFAVMGKPGDTVYIAVPSPTPITSFTINDVVYNGVQGIATDMMITFPTSPTAEIGMAISGSEIFMSDTSSVFAFPKTIGATASEYGAAEGITTAHLGYDIVFAGGSLFSVDSTTSTTANRLFRVYDGVTWGPGTLWDVTPTYATNSPTYGIGTDGVQLFMSTRRTGAGSGTDFYSLATGAAGTPMLLGTNPSVWYVVGLAVDDLYFYVASNGVGGEGVYRVSRTNIASPALKMAAIDTSTLCNNIEIDAFTNPQYLYVREYGGDVHVIVQPASASPAHLGAISTLGTTSDYAMTYDKATGHIYLFETETDSAGRIVRLQ